MAETDVHRRLLIDLLFALDNHFRSSPDVYVSGNLLIYYVEGDPGKSVAPDVFVTRGIAKGPRRVYKLWEEVHAPNVVIELSSRRTWREDLQLKWRLYESLGVAEYFIFDPEYDYLTEALIGYRLVDGQYVPLEIAQGRVHSEALNLDLVNTGETLRLSDPLTSQFLPIAQEEADARREAEVEIARLRAQLETTQGQ